MQLEHVALRKVRLQPWVLLKVYDFKVYNCFYLKYPPHQLFCFIFDLGFLLLNKLFTHAGSIDKARKTVTIQTIIEDLCCTDRFVLHLFLSSKRSFVRTALLAWLRKANEMLTQYHYAWNNEGETEQQKELKIIMKAHFINKVTNVPGNWLTFRAARYREKQRFCICHPWHIPNP